MMNEAISVGAFILSLLAFGKTAWLTYRDRPKLKPYINKSTITNRDSTKSLDNMQIRVANVGYRPIILEKFIAISIDGKSYDAGNVDLHAALNCKIEQKLPAMIKPGNLFKFHAMEIQLIINNNNLNDNKAKYLYFGFVDSFNHFWPIDAEVVLDILEIKKLQKVPNRFEKLKSYAYSKVIFNRYKSIQRKTKV